MVMAGSRSLSVLFLLILVAAIEYKLVISVKPLPHARSELKILQDSIVERINANSAAGWKAAMNPRFSNYTVNPTIHDAQTIIFNSCMTLLIITQLLTLSFFVQVDQFKYILGVKQSPRNTLDKIPVKTYPKSLGLPKEFDARSTWSQCITIGRILDQGHCGSCWAFGAVEALSDRFCIHFDMNISLSVNDLLACCGFKCGDGCDGGYPIYAWRYFVENGVVTEECDPYFDQVGCAHPGCEPVYPTPRCEKKCKVENLLWENSKRYSINAYKINHNSHDIMAEVYQNGPVEVAFTVYEDFAHYKSGVYRHITGDELGGHAVKLIGWGTSEQGEDFWLLANQWNRGWGDDGYFKILRGQNECGIEEDVVAGLPSTKNLLKTFAWMDDTVDASA